MWAVPQEVRTSEELIQLVYLDCSKMLTQFNAGASCAREYPANHFRPRSLRPKLRACALGSRASRSRFASRAHVLAPLARVSHLAHVLRALWLIYYIAQAPGSVHRRLARGILIFVSSDPLLARLLPVSGVALTVDKDHQVAPSPFASVALQLFAVRNLQQ